MLAVKDAKQDKATIAQLKAQYLKFYEDCLVQKYVAQSIAKDQDTIIRWKTEDEDSGPRICGRDSESGG